MCKSQAPRLKSGLQNFPLESYVFHEAAGMTSSFLESYFWKHCCSSFSVSSWWIYQQLCPGERFLALSSQISLFPNICFISPVCPILFFSYIIRSGPHIASFLCTCRNILFFNRLHSANPASLFQLLVHHFYTTMNTKKNRMKMIIIKCLYYFLNIIEEYYFPSFLSK